jgi:hypothetical protein
MRAPSEIRLIVFKMEAFAVNTRSVTVAEYVDLNPVEWTILAIDPDDSVAYNYWQEVKGFRLRSLT